MNAKTAQSWHQLHPEEMLQLLEVNLQTGLASEEVKRRQENFGANRITPHRGIPAWLKFLRQFNPPLVDILLVALTAAPARAVGRPQAGTSTPVA
ncbi:MAG: hypothetical protein L0Z50_39610 [Verrucomicrobiales bacterium]|nr:hypothetical protein [Verrucomicrobiales bacterium]